MASAPARDMLPRCALQATVREGKEGCGPGSSAGTTMPRVVGAALGRLVGLVATDADTCATVRWRGRFGRTAPRSRSLSMSALCTRLFFLLELLNSETRSLTVSVPTPWQMAKVLGIWQRRQIISAALLDPATAQLAGQAAEQEEARPTSERATAEQSLDDLLSLALQLPLSSVMALTYVGKVRCRAALSPTFQCLKAPPPSPPHRRRARQANQAAARARAPLGCRRPPAALPTCRMVGGWSSRSATWRRSGKRTRTCPKLCPALAALMRTW
jgi:hypothetical protein